MSNIIFIVIAVLFWVVKAIIKANQKVSPNSSESNHSVTTSPDRDQKFHSILNEFVEELEREVHPKRAAVTKPKIKNYSDREIDRVLDQNLNDIYSSINDLKLKADNELHKREKVTDNGRFLDYAVNKNERRNQFQKALKNKGKLKQAVILSEVLNRKF